MHGRDSEDALEVFGGSRVAGVAHTPHREKRRSGYAFRRRIPARTVEISNRDQSSALCLSLRADALSEASPFVRALTALTDLGFAMMRERRMAHLGADSLTLLTELARCQIALREKSRAMADPRSEEAANAAAAAERATQAVLRRALAHEALKVLLDVSRERERRETGLYETPTPIFGSVMAAKMPAYATTTTAIPSPQSVPAGAPQPVAATVPWAAAPIVRAPIAVEMAVPEPPFPTTAIPAPQPASTAVPPPVDQAAAPAAEPAPSPTVLPTYAPAPENETAFRIKTRPPRLGNIDLRDLTPEMR